MPTTATIEIHHSGRPRVVIVGGGFGGVRAAKALTRAPVGVFIIDRSIGRGYAILDGFGLRMAGMMASMIWAIIHVQFLALNTMQFATIMQWMVSALTNQRSARLIIETREGGNGAAG